jgi:aminomethyltransferase
MEAVLARTPLDALHRELGARMLPFAGFEMPIQYGGILREHEAVRKRAGLFDLSHMAQFEILGPAAAIWLDSLTANRVATIKPFGARYNLIMNEAGGVRDDVIIYRLADRYLVVANAGNASKLALHFAAWNSAGAVRIVNLHKKRALLALQGPASLSILQAVVEPAIASLPYYECAVGRLFGAEALIARTGYTGEDGFELFVENTIATELFRRLLGEGEAVGLVPVGLGARDILRLEAGMPLYGQELGEEFSPFQSGQGWAVKLDKGEFIGRAALRVRKDLPEPKIAALRLLEKVPARPGYPVFARGRRVGEIRSASIAPACENQQIATALVEAEESELGRTLDVEIRGTFHPAQVVALPFYRRQVDHRQE